MAAIQGLVGIVALVFGLIGIGLFGSISDGFNPLIPGPPLEVSSAPYYAREPAWKDDAYTNRGAGEGACFQKEYAYAAYSVFSHGGKGFDRNARKSCDPEDDEEHRATLAHKFMPQIGIESLAFLYTPALYGSAALAVAGLIGMAAAAGKAAPEVMGAAFGTALVFNLVAFGLACQIVANTNYGPSLAQIKAGPSLELWSTYFSHPCYSNDWQSRTITIANERCAPGSLTESALAFAILNCLINIVAFVVSVCGQDMAPKVKG